MLSRSFTVEEDTKVFITTSGWTFFVFVMKRKDLPFRLFLYMKKSVGRHLFLFN